MKRVVGCLLFIVAILPLLAPSHRNSNSQPPTPVVAFAGEGTQTTRCDCTQPGCVCPSQPTNTTSVAPPDSNLSGSPSTQSPEEVDLGSLTLALFLALIVFAKLGL